MGVGERVHSGGLPQGSGGPCCLAAKDRLPHQKSDKWSKKKSGPPKVVALFAIWIMGPLDNGALRKRGNLRHGPHFILSRSSSVK